jgi:pimeloyl-ACP methyl ester carboxylesterase
MLNRQIDYQRPASRGVQVVEEPVQFGDDQRGFAMLTLPGPSGPAAPHLPVFVFLNGGLLHRVGPYRLYVRMARQLAKLGFTSLRVDLTGRGDTAMRKASSYRQAIAADYADIKTLLTSRIGSTPVVLVGLCSGADDSVRLAIDDPDVNGIVLFDAVCFKDRGFALRSVLATASECLRHPLFHTQLLLRRLNKLKAGKRRINPLDVREAPSLEQMRSAIAAVGERDGRALIVYTRYASRFYNRQGQMKDVLAYDGYDRVCTELYWPDVSHTYLIDVHRRRVIDTVTQWARAFVA